MASTKIDSADPQRRSRSPVCATRGATPEPAGRAAVASPRRGARAWPRSPRSWRRRCRRTARSVPGRVLCACASSSAGCAAALVVGAAPSATSRRAGRAHRELLAAPIALLGAVLLARGAEDTHHGADASRPQAAALAARGAFPAVGPAPGARVCRDGRLRSSGPAAAHRVVGYAAAVGVAAVAVRAAAGACRWTVAARRLVVGCARRPSVGYVRAMPTGRRRHERARLQWVGWGVVVAAAITVGRGDPEHVGRRGRIPSRRSRWARPSSCPLALAVGRRTARPCRDRPPPGPHHHAHRAPRSGRRVVPRHRARSRPHPDEQRAVAARPVDARRRGRGAPVGARPRTPDRRSRPDVSTASGTHPTSCCARFGSRLTRALPLDELLLQLAESLKKTMALDVAEVWTRASTGRLERAVSVPDRGRADAHARRRRGEPSSPAPACRVRRGRRSGCPASSPGDEAEPVLRVAPDHQLG